MLTEVKESLRCAIARHACVLVACTLLVETAVRMFCYRSSAASLLVHTGCLSVE